MDKQFYAKSKQESGAQPTVGEHLSRVAALAKGYGSVFGQEQEAELCGLFHDFGKYSDRFQGVLRGTHMGIDHALCGAALLSGKAGTRYLPEVEAINGHHGGLTSFGQISTGLATSLSRSEPVRCNDGKEAALAGKAEYTAALQAFCRDFPDFLFPKRERLPATNPVARMLETRMLFSCLVDADYTASAEESGCPVREAQNEFDAGQCLDRLLEHRKNLTARSAADSTLNRFRNALFDRCGEEGDRPGGLFTLTAPTGTGKTLALLHFALRHCMARGKRRVIFVLPFLTLTEQCAAIYQALIPELLEDHSQKNLPEEAQELAARWNAPAVVTTSVKFFESLFAREPTDCRKLHNIAESVIVFDEAQSLNPELMTATLQAVNTLCAHYGCTAVFSSATQPCFEAIPGLEWKPRELMPDAAAMFETLRRTRVEWRLSEETAFENIAQELETLDSVCAIVNLRRHARKLYRLLSQRCEQGSVLFLSTDLCPAHRSRQLALIKQRQQAGLPCRVVSTQCIEAGVDLDFKALYRALAPLDAIIQAAGRCNRNGRNPAGGKVVVFIPAEEGNLYPGVWYENAALTVLRLSKEKELDIHSPADIRRYYRELFSHAKDKRALRLALEKKDYAETAQEYRLIASQGYKLLVPYQAAWEQYALFAEQARNSGMTQSLMRAAAGITVSTYLKAEELAYWAEPLYLPKKRNAVCMESGYYVLRPQHGTCYTEDMGLRLEKEQNEIYLI